MTRTRSENIECTNCEHGFSAVSYDSINTRLDPELAEKFLKGELNKVVCPNCKHENTVSKPVLYHDTQSRIMIWVLPSLEEEFSLEEREEIIRMTTAKFKESLSNFCGLFSQADYTFDIVFGVSELKESLKSIKSGNPNEKIEAITRNVLEVDNFDKYVTKNEASVTRLFNKSAFKFWLFIIATIALAITMFNGDSCEWEGGCSSDNYIILKLFIRDIPRGSAPRSPLRNGLENRWFSKIDQSEAPAYPADTKRSVVRGQLCCGVY